MDRFLLRSRFLFLHITGSSPLLVMRRDVSGDAKWWHTLRNLGLDHHGVIMRSKAGDIYSITGDLTDPSRVKPTESDLRTTSRSQPSNFQPGWNRYRSKKVYNGDGVPSLRALRRLVASRAVGIRDYID